jgi:hypothetical protein
MDLGEAHRGYRGGVDTEQGVEPKMMARQGPREFPAATVARDWRFGSRR